MTPGEWTVIKEIAADAMARPAAERDAYLAARCGANESLRREVQSLIESVAKAANLYEQPRFAAAGLLASLAEEGPAGPSPGDRIGAYRILSEIGRGGMGAAYLAARDDGAYEKHVAIKLIKRGMDTDAILRRFRHERQILATLEHPNIVMLLDGGTTSDGLPYFVMEYVDGRPVDAFCDEHRLTIPQRLTLFQAVCGAVQYAHERRVVHRDLKPSNILVTKSGAPKLLDFGIAKLLDAGHDTHTVDATLTGRLLTPLYASPEQVRGEAVTAASDVYSLGVLLYALLTGQHPYGPAGSHAGPRTVCDHVPSRPSTVVGDAGSASRGERADRLRRRLTGNLDVIIMTALQKDPARRYASVQALSADIERHLDGRPIAARRAYVAAGLGWPAIRAFVGAGFSRAAIRALVEARVSRPAIRAFVGAGFSRPTHAIAIILLAISLAAVIAASRRTPPVAASADARSIAVLPLMNSSGNADVEYLADGITEDVISRLSLVPDLKVIARDSAYRYKGRGIDPQQVGRELGVDVVLTGSVTERDNGVTISAELVDARDRRRIWGERYERAVGDVQGVQRELAQQIAASLRLQFTSDQRARLDKQHTADAGAYELFLKGRYFLNKRTPDGLRTSARYFSDAVTRDPSFALAYSGLADAYGLLTEYHTVPAAETYAPVRDAVSKALALDASLAEAHTSQAYFRQFYEWNMPGAEAAFTHALALNPGYATGHQWYAEFLSASGRHAEALAEIRTAAALDPVSLIVNAVEANLLYMAGDYDASIAKSQQVIDLDPNFPEVYEYLKRAYDQKGMYEQAIAARQGRRRILGRDITPTAALAAAASATSAREYWRQRLAQEVTESRDEGIQPFEFAEILAQAGDTARALDWLERACAEHDFMMTYVRVAPNLRPLRTEPRYVNLLRRGCRVQP